MNFSSQFIDWYADYLLMQEIKEEIKEEMRALNRSCRCAECAAKEAAVAEHYDAGISHQNSEWDRDLAKLEKDRSERGTGPKRKNEERW